ncbi:MAG: peptidylprolyl isomerase [Dehalococcoidia bacterium]|jgi:cyclophilin family peptidyl-prolyl cis-trans isomerase
MPKSKQPKNIKRKGRKPRGAADWSGPAVQHGPFGIFSKIKLFYVFGALIMVGSLTTGLMAIWGGNGSSTPAATPVGTVVQTDTPTPGGTDVTPTPTVEQVKQWPAAPAMNIDPTKSYTATIVVADKGTIQVQLDAADAPNTVNNFVFLAQQGFYNNLPFYYVDPDAFAATGDPAGNGKGGPGYEIANEPNKLTFDVGSLGMFASDATGMRAGSRFFITLNPSRLDSTDFWPFGKVTSGLDVLQSLAKGDVIQSIQIAVQ